jgi:hypothetical protein
MIGPIPGVVAIVCLFSCLCVHAWSPGTSQPGAVQGFAVNSANRTDALAFYNTIFTASEGYGANMTWTGNLTTGVPGTTAATFKDDVRRRINYYRAVSGLPADIVFDATKSAKCQEAALMFAANGQLSHTPPSSWTYYTANASSAAGSSNIALGNYGPDAIDAYMRDDGSNNIVVGHRRWILYSLAQEMGTGDVPVVGSSYSSNALWVIGNFKSSAPKAFVAWPNEGFVAQDLVPARWSLSYSGGNFSAASVTMTQNGTTVPVTVISRADNGYGENTIVWEPSGIEVGGLQDVAYNVSVTGITGTGVPTSYAYSVTAFNPGVLGQSMTITGSATPPVTGQTYTFNSIDQTDQYQFRVSTGSSAAWSEGSESLANIIDNTAPDYQLSQSTVKRSGSQAFHLAFPSLAAGAQGFEISRDIIPTAGSNLVFYDLFRWATTGSTLSAEVSADGGSTWTAVWSRAGNGSGWSADWDQAFNARSVSLSAYAGKPIRIRFVYRLSGSTFIGVGTNYGVFLDDISVSNAAELINTTTTVLAGSATSFTLDASTAGASLVAGQSYYLRVRPNVGTRWFADSPPLVVTPQAATFATWQTDRFTSGEISAGLAAATEDPDGDGLPNLLEYAFGTLPKASGNNPVLADVSDGKIWVSFPCDTARTDLVYTVQSSSDLVGWTDIARSTGGGATLPIGALATVSDSTSGQRTVTVTDATAIPVGGRRFLRVKVVGQ